MKSTTHLKSQQRFRNSHIIPTSMRGSISQHPQPRPHLLARPSHFHVLDEQEYEVIRLAHRLCLGRVIALHMALSSSIAHSR